MTAPHRRAEDDADAAASPAHIAVTVTRTGGFAGVRRVWSAGPPATDAPEWPVLLRSCPWDDAASSTPEGADRFVWSIRARNGRELFDVRLGDGELNDAWRDLIDAVRALSG